jgi:hypothetical protein
MLLGETAAPVRNFGPSRVTSYSARVLALETQGWGTRKKPGKSRSLVIRPHENMRANFLGMTALRDL